jgi:DNA polymerase (family X)
MVRLENSEIAALFGEMADLLQIQGGDRHRVSAFRRAARLIEGLPRPAEELLGRGELDKVRGIGPGTVHRVKQMLRTHTCEDLEALRRQVPPGLREMIKIKGIGATTARNIHNRLGVTSIEQLEHAAKVGGIESIPRMGAATANKILAGIEAYRKRRGKVALIEAQRVGRRLVEALTPLAQAERVALAGSVRRGKATIGDLDILVATADPLAVTARFQTLPDVEEVLLAGEGRCSVRLHNQQQADLRLLPRASFGAGLHYFTGSKAHNIALRQRANRMGLKVSDKGVFVRPAEASQAGPENGGAGEVVGEVLIDGCAEEEAVFHRLGLPWIPPELREGEGEIEAAERGRLPQLVVGEDLLGDLHMHTTDSDGRDGARAMAERGRELGHRYLAITDHSKSLRIANGLDEVRLAAQLERLRRLDAELDGIRVLSGIEVDILADGSLDLDPGLLAQLDWVVASVHQWTEQSPEEMTQRVIRAIESGVVDCIGHPSGRRPGKRDPYPMDLEAILAAARDLDVALECNGGPNRMDLGDIDCRRCRERGVAVVLNTDAHAASHLGRHEYALSMARRGWLERKHVLNAQPWEVLAERRTRRLRDHGERRWRAVPALVQVPGGRVEVDDPAVVDAPASEAEDLDVHAWAEPAPEPEPALEPATDAPASEPRATELDDSPDRPEDLAQLRASLGERPVSEALRERLRAWLMSGAEDPTLEAALAGLGDNPLQLGFDLLSSP